MNWRKGPPPSIGWWPASTRRDPDALRWWNGLCWSLLCRPSDDIKMVLVCAGTPDTDQCNIEWTDRPAWWPERSKT